VAPNCTIELAARGEAGSVSYDRVAQEDFSVPNFAWTPSPNLPRERVSFAGVPREEMLRRARELAPVLAARAGECERLRRLPDETERDLHRLGLFRIVQPARVGGADLDVGALVEVCAAVAEACPATAWNLGNLASHHWMLGYFPPAAQDELWDVSPDVLIASSLAFPAGRGRKVEGGYVVSGRWPFSSGVDNSDWNLLAVTVRDSDDGPPVDQRFALVHRSEYEIIDNWFAMGLCGTGSKDVQTKDLFVPDYRTTSINEMRGGPHVGSAVNPSPLFRTAMMAIGTNVLTGAALGCSRGAWRSYVERTRRRNTTYTGLLVGGFQAVQIKVSEAATLIDAATLLLLEDCRHAMARAEAGEVPSLEEKLRYRRNGAWAVQQCREAVDMIMGVSGAGGLYTTGDMQRFFRDAHAIAAHIMYSFDLQASMFGQHVLGIPGPPPLL
jgi:3-hydroxy-9,10-secoandrosta-1,3,5(10)-triene-9,17-dione monooxygenase